MSLFRRLAARFSPGSLDQYHITIGGLDCAGKTTLIYLLKLKEIVSTIPTVGINVETIALPSSLLSIGGGPQWPSMTITMWETRFYSGRGASFFYALQVHAERGDGLIWMVSGVDEDRLQDSAEELRLALEHIDKHTPKSLKTKKKPLLILVNKQDLPEAFSVDKVRTAFREILSKWPACGIIPTSAVRGLGSESGLPQAFCLLHAAIGLSRRQVQDSTKASAEQIWPVLPPHATKELNEWFLRLKDDYPPNELFIKFETGHLARWDHYVKIRVLLYLLLKHDRGTGERLFMDVLARHKQYTETDDGTPHVTMSSFWLQMVHFGIIHTSFNTTSIAQNAALEAGGSQPEARKGAFICLLANSPYLVNDKLWADYYSEEVIHNREARNGLILPDRKPLPSFTTLRK